MGKGRVGRRRKAQGSRQQAVAVAVAVARTQTVFLLSAWCFLLRAFCLVLLPSSAYCLLPTFLRSPLPLTLFPSSPFSSAIAPF